MEPFTDTDEIETFFSYTDQEEIDRTVKELIESVEGPPMSEPDNNNRGIIKWVSANYTAVIVTIVGGLVVAILLSLWNIPTRIGILEGYHTGEPTDKATVLALQSTTQGLTNQINALQGNYSDISGQLQYLTSSMDELRTDVRNIQSELGTFQRTTGIELERIRGDIRIIEQQRIRLDIGSSKAHAAKYGYAKRDSTGHWFSTKAGKKMLGTKLMSTAKELGEKVARTLEKPEDFDKAFLAAMLEKRPNDLNLLSEAADRKVTLKALMGTLLCYAFKETFDESTTNGMTKKS